VARKKRIEIDLEKAPKRNPYVVPARKRKAGALEERAKKKSRKKPRMPELLAEE
jgi:hypothetical protein